MAKKPEDRERIYTVMARREAKVLLAASIHIFARECELFIYAIFQRVSNLHVTYALYVINIHA